MQLHIRDATVGDLLAVVEIERLAFDNPWSVASFRRELSLPFSRLLVAQTSPDPDAPIAGFLCRWLVADEYHILNIAVRPELHRRGIGARLLAFAINEAEEKDARVATLEVRRSNLGGRSLYRRFGFEDQRVRRNYYGPGEDAIVMDLRFDGKRQES